jgi:hypothetical protein
MLWGPSMPLAQLQNALQCSSWQNCRPGKSKTAFWPYLCVCVDEQDEAVLVHGQVTKSNKLTVTLLPHL